MTDNTELKRLAAAIESCSSIPEEDEAAWMRRTTGRAVVELLEELENFKAEVPKWTEREIKLIADNEALRGLYQMHKQTETREMRDLKAEVAGLRTGYEAYERVNAELKAENEQKDKRIQYVEQQFYDTQIERDQLKTDNDSLRADAERFRHLMFSHVDRVWNGRKGASMLTFGPFTPHELRKTIDAAIGKGEQS